MQIIFQDPYASLNPRMRVRNIIGESLAHPQHRHRGRAQEARLRAARDGRPQRRARRALPARVLRRAAPAHRHRPRPGAQPQAHHLRRAGQRPRRVHPRPGHQPARGPAGRVRPHLPVHRPRPVRGQAHLRPRRRDVPRQDRRDRRQRRALRPAAAPLHRGAALGGADPGPAHGAQRGGASSSRATCPARPTRRRAASSTRAARAPRRSAPTAMPALASTGGDAGERHEVACYFPARFHDGERTVASEPFAACFPAHD